MKITKLKKAFKGFVESYNIEVVDDIDLLTQLNETRETIKNHLEIQLNVLEGIKHMETLKVTFQKTIRTAYSNKL